MKKFLLAAALIIGVVVSQFVIPSQAQAAELYCFSETRGGKTTDTYVLTDSVQGTDYGFKVRLHSVGRNYSYSNYWEVGFVKRGNEIYIVWLPSTSTTLIARGNTVIEPDYVKILQVLRDNK